MGRHRKSRKKKEDLIEYEYEKEIEFTCPVRGLVKQVVKVKRYKPQYKENTNTIINVDDPIESDDALPDSDEE